MILVPGSNVNAVIYFSFSNVIVVFTRFLSNYKRNSVQRSWHIFVIKPLVATGPVSGLNPCVGVVLSNVSCV